ncbi:MAG: hypothetical protein LBG43_00365 [Treponema sp.]|nr:hypothetical protein [Treponema sp.]
MRNGRNSTPLLTAILFLALTLCSGCATGKAATTAEIERAIKAVAPETPSAPVLEPVEFQDRDGGLWLTYNDYRALERNVIALREYAARLETAIAFYREDK